MDIKITQATHLKNLPDESSLGFGTTFTDHMFLLDYSQEKGWHNASIKPYGPFSMDPATMVLHYGQAIFEGLKAYKTEQGDINLFRAKDNFRRLNQSAKQLCIPEVDIDFLYEAMKKLIDLDQRWVPGKPGTSLYIRPAIIAYDPYIGLRSSHTYRLFIILSPVGAYYPEGFNPVKIWVTQKYVRAVRGGVGQAKTAGNYAASLYATDLAQKEGYTQVMWLDGVNLKYVEEVGSMNIFFKIDNKIITPQLNGSILSGITRDSVIKLATSWGMDVSERRISIDEIFDAHSDGKLQEVFGSGTAAVISPVGKIKCDNKEITIGDGRSGETASKLFSELMNIQYGKAEDTFGWITKI